MKTNFTKHGFARLEFVLSIGFVLLFLLFLLKVAQPDEYLKRQRDMRLIEDAQILLQAFNRFYITVGRLPWADDLATNNPLPGLDWTNARDPSIGICADSSCQKPGELLTTGFLPGFLQKEFIKNPADAIYIGKGRKKQDPIFACFIPFSDKLRQSTGSLYKIDVDKGFPPYGVVQRCPYYTKWKETSICYYCVVE